MNPWLMINRKTLLEDMKNIKKVAENIEAAVAKEREFLDESKKKDIKTDEEVREHARLVR